MVINDTPKLLTSRIIPLIIQLDQYIYIYICIYIYIVDDRCSSIQLRIDQFLVEINLPTRKNCRVYANLLSFLPLPLPRGALDFDFLWREALSAESFFFPGRRLEPLALRVGTIGLSIGLPSERWLNPMCRRALPSSRPCGPRSPQQN